MRDRVQLDVLALRRHVVQHQHRAGAAGEEVLQRQDLAAVAQRVLRQEPHLGQAVEDDPRRVQRGHAVEHHLRGFGELHLRGVEHRQLPARVEGGLRRHELEHLDAVQRPAVPLGDEAQLPLRLRQGDVERGLAPAGALAEELEGQGGLAGAGPPLAQVKAVRVQPAAQDVVEPRGACRNPRRLRHVRRRRLSILFGHVPLPPPPEPLATARGRAAASVPLVNTSGGFCQVEFRMPGQALPRRRGLSPGRHAAGPQRPGERRRRLAEVGVGFAAAVATRPRRPFAGPGRSLRRRVEAVDSGRGPSRPSRLRSERLALPPLAAHPGDRAGDGSARPPHHMPGMTERLRDRADPPAAPLPRALWLGLRGEWEAAHEIVQAHDDADAAWVHA